MGLGLGFGLALQDGRGDAAQAVEGDARVGDPLESLQGRGRGGGSRVLRGRGAGDGYGASNPNPNPNPSPNPNPNPKGAGAHRGEDVLLRGSSRACLLRSCRGRRRIRCPRRRESAHKRAHPGKDLAEDHLPPRSKQRVVGRSERRGTVGLARGLVRVVGLEMGPKDGSKGWTGQGWADWGGAVRWVPHGKMPADIMNKADPSKGNDALSHLLKLESATFTPA